MKALLPIAACLLITAACPAQARPDPALTSVRQRIQAADFRATGRFVELLGTSRVTTGFTLRGHWFADGLRLLYQFNTGGKQPQRVLLRVDDHGRITVTGKLPTLSQPGLLITPEDLAEAQFFWPTQTLPVPPEKIGPRTCTLLRSTPPDAAASRYASVTSCVDPSIGWPLRVERTLATGAPPLQMTYGGLRQSSGVWTATEIHIQTAGTPTGALLLIDRGTAKAHLTLKDFDLKQPTAEPAE